MKSNYSIHDEMYIQARQNGWDGWGGNDRIQKSELVTRYLELKTKPNKGKLLEIGCGEGHHCRSFANLGFDVTGFDISETAIEWAREKSKLEELLINFEVRDITSRSSATSEKYDVVIDCNCLHCIVGNDRGIVLEWIYQTLNDNGSFFVSSLCSKSDSSFELPKDGYIYRHVTTRNDLIRELREVGFEVKAVEVYERDSIDHITVHATK